MTEYIVGLTGTITVEANSEDEALDIALSESIGDIEAKILQPYEDVKLINSCSETAAMFMDNEAAIKDRANFVSNVGILVSQTRERVESITYSPEPEEETELAVIHYKGGATKYINIRCDSYSAIVRDIFKNL